MNTVNTTNTSGLWILIFPFLMFVFAVWSVVFWIRMLIHVAKHDVENKVVWILIIVLTGILGAIIYYFVVKKDFDKQAPKMPAPPDSPMPPAPTMTS
jgi:prolipoprotein diacylglyceryltransferase